MGATHTCKQTAYTVCADDGQLFFLLSESTFESNVYPRKAHACVTFAGTAEACMGRAIRYASDCEGGMLKGPSACITPENYINKWRIALRTAKRIDANLVMVNFKFSTSWMGIAVSKRGDVESLLKGVGVDLVATATPSADGYRVSLSSVISVLPQMMALGILMWQIIEDYQLQAACCEVQLGYTVRKTKATPSVDGIVVARYPQTAETMSHDRDYFLQRAGRADWSLGWAYSTVASLIINEVTQAEIQCPGSAEHATGYLRELVKAAPLLDGKTRMRMTRPAESDPRYWKRQDFDAIASALKKTGTCIELKLVEVMHDRDLLQKLKGMGPEHLEFIEVLTSDGSCVHATGEEELAV